MRILFWFLILTLSGIWLWSLEQLEVREYVQQNYLPPLVKSEALNNNLSDYFSDNLYLTNAVNTWYEQLSPQAQVGQLIMPAWDESTSFATLERSIKNEIIGGFMVLRKEFSPEQIAALKRRNKNSVPLFVSVDAEPSLLKYRFNDSVFNGETADLKTQQEIEATGKDILNLLQHYGINLNFAPVYDVGVNQSVIGARAFSKLPEEAATRANILSKFWIQSNLIPTAKHFPGHGTVVGDTHKGLEIIRGELTELIQFRKAIKAQVPMIMVGHLAVETLGYDTEGLPATLSPLMMQDLLRHELNFKGVVITDAMNMKAVSEIEDASLKALQAGADIVLMPKDSETLNTQILDLIKLDTAFGAEVEAKVKRVLRLKLAWEISEMYNN